MNEIHLDGTYVAQAPINIRAGFQHLHSGEIECGIAYLSENTGQWAWAPCSKLLNHKGKCGYADNTCY